MLTNNSRAVNNVLKSNADSPATLRLQEALDQESPAQTWYLAAMAATDRAEKLDLLQRALAVDPFHHHAVVAWEGLVQEPYAEADTGWPTKAEVLNEAVQIFQEHGWEMKVEMLQNVQFEKSRRLNKMISLALIGIFSVIGLVVVLAGDIAASKARVHLQLQGDGTLVAIGGRERMSVRHPDELTAVAAAVQSGISYRFAIILGISTLPFWFVMLNIVL